MPFLSNRELNFEQLFDELGKLQQENFQTIWLLGQKRNPHDSRKLVYFIAELIKHKRISPFFEVPIDWTKIEEEINKALTK